MTPKFRAWDRLTGKIFPVGIIDYSIQAVYIEEPNGLDSCRNFDEIELMQSTGLEDKNGREIYEGDIVRYKLGRNIFTEVVAYDKESAGFGVVYNGVDGIIFSFGELWEDIDLHNLEVIGNKYNNPELLKGEGE